MITWTRNISDLRGVLSAISVVNIFCLLGFLKGALSCLARTFKQDMKLAAAKVFPVFVPDEFIQIDYITPTIFD